MKALRILVATLLVACGSSTGPMDEETRLALAEGEKLDLRITALEAFRGQRAETQIVLTNTTVEGVPIVTTLSTMTGRAIVRLDETRDGGGIRTDTLSTLELVRYVPSVWINNTEVEKEKLVVVEPTTAKASSGTYYLRGRCSTRSCEWVI